MSAERWAELRGPGEAEGAPEKEHADPYEGQNVWRRAKEEDDEGDEGDGGVEEERGGGIHAQPGMGKGLALSDCLQCPPPHFDSPAPRCSSLTCGSRRNSEEPDASSCTEILHLGAEEHKHIPV